MKLLTICLMLSSAFLRAQDDPFRDIFFPPELVIQNQQALGLSDDQRNYLSSEVSRAQATFTELQWKLQDEIGKLTTLLRQQPADEQKSLGQLDKVLAVERDVKKAQVTLMLRMRNNLHPEQIAKLREIQAKHLTK